MTMLTYDGEQPIYKQGGYMAKGGDLSLIKKKYEENEDENAHSENVVLLAKHFGTKGDLAKAKEILALHEKEGYLSSENGKKRTDLHYKLIDKARAEMDKQGIKFEKGGYMAKGGKTKDQEVVRGYFEDEAYEYGKGGKTKSFYEVVYVDRGDSKKVVAKFLDKNEAYASANALMEEMSKVGKTGIYKVAENTTSKFKDGGYMADGGKVIGYTMYYEPQKNLGGKSVQTDADIRVNYKLMDSVLDKKLGDNYLGGTFYIGDGYGKIALENDSKKNEVKAILEMYDFEDATKMYSKEKGGYMADGGSVAKGNYEMLMSQAKEVMHHAEELMQVVKPNMDIEAWVVSKAERATTDLSDITHYLDGLKMAMGGMVKANSHKVNA
jgi:hypothetical protein